MAKRARRCLGSTSRQRSRDRLCTDDREGSDAGDSEHLPSKSSPDKRNLHEAVRLSYLYTQLRYASGFLRRGLVTKAEERCRLLASLCVSQYSKLRFFVTRHRKLRFYVNCAFPYLGKRRTDSRKSALCLALSQKGALCVSAVPAVPAVPSGVTQSDDVSRSTHLYRLKRPCN